MRWRPQHQPSGFHTGGSGSGNCSGWRRFLARASHWRMRFKAHDLLVATNRQTSGRGYELLRDSLRRLKGTEIETNLRQGANEHLSGFGLIDGYEIVRETRDGRMLDVEITLSDWVFDAIENNHILTLSRQYFHLRKPLERRLYELARKHCGAQPEWKIGLELLRDKCGSGSSLMQRFQIPPLQRASATLLPGVARVATPAPCRIASRSTLVKSA